MLDEPIYPRKKTTNRSVWWVVGINFLLPLAVIALFETNYLLSNLRLLWIVPITIAALSIVVLLISLFAVVIIQRPQYEPLIYFIGQLLITAGFCALPVIGFFSARLEKIDNREMVTLHDGRDTLRLQSLRQLENSLGVESGLALDISYLNCTGSASGDSVCAVFLTYTTKQSADETLTSKHIFRGTSGKMVYSGIPYRENRELRKLKAEIDKVEEAVEDLNTNLPDSIKNK